VKKTVVFRLIDDEYTCLDGRWDIDGTGTNSTIDGAGKNAPRWHARLFRERYTNDEKKRLNVCRTVNPDVYGCSVGNPTTSDAECVGDGGVADSARPSSWYPCGSGMFGGRTGEREPRVPSGTLAVAVGTATASFDMAHDGVRVRGALKWSPFVGWFPTECHQTPGADSGFDLVRRHRIRIRMIQSDIIKT
jgi:hypothetical protein